MAVPFDQIRWLNYYIWTILYNLANLGLPRKYNLLSLNPNGKQLGHFVRIAKRNIFTKRIRNRGNFDPSILVVQKQRSLGRQHHTLLSLSHSNCEWSVSFLCLSTKDNCEKYANSTLRYLSQKFHAINTTERRHIIKPILVLCFQLLLIWQLQFSSQHSYLLLLGWVLHVLQSLSENHTFDPFREFVPSAT